MMAIDSLNIKNINNPRDSFNYANTNLSANKYQSITSVVIEPDFRILIANDDNFQQKIISKLLSVCGNLFIEEAENG
jgi:hypothetical protein